MFDLDKSVAAWRRTLEHTPALTPDDAEELVQHLRDQVAAFRADGLPDAEAFRRAMALMGDYATAEQEYRKVYWRKLKRRRALGDVLSGKLGLFRSYAVLAFRSLRRQKGYAFLNVFGLAVGLAAFILILRYVQHERSFDRFHTHADRLYRVVQRQPLNLFVGSDRFAVTPALVARDLLAEFPDVAAATTIGDQSALLSLGERHHWEHGLWADARFFDVFSFPLLRGNPATALADAGSIVLTASLARKLFGGDDPMGRTVRFEGRDAFTVTGVAADVPATSHFTFAFVAAIAAHPRYAQSLAEQQWQQNAWYTYLVLAEGADAEALQAKLPAFVDRHRYADRPEVPTAQRARFYLQPLADIHLRSRVNFELGVNGDVRQLYVFSAIAVTILLLACVNYTNLAVARSLRRTREVGLRKVVGAGRHQITGQFLGESVLMAFLALGLALGLVHLLLPLFGRLVDRPLRMDYLGQGLLPGLLGLVVLVGVLAGSYPALFMAAVRPLRALAGQATGRPTRLRVQRGLVVGQYAVSIALIAMTFVLYAQLRYVRQKPLGYDREHVVAVRVRDPAAVQHYAVIRDAWLRDPRVLAVASSRHLPTNIESSTGIHGWEGSRPEETLRIYQVEADYDFLGVFGIGLAAGRTFSREVASDVEEACLINETAARALGWSAEEAVGKHVHREGEPGPNTIVGVVKDFHLHSLHLPVEPLLIDLHPGWMWYVSAKVRGDDLPETLATLERAVKRFSPYPFEYQFLDEHLDQLYASDRRLGETVGFFTVLALLIAALGLFGLAAFAAEQRTKEIGIRKALGAHAAGLVALLSKDVLRLVVLAFVVGAPVAYVAVERWLDGFAYRIALGPGIFVLAGAAALVLALLAVGYQAVRAAFSDPVTCLRHE